MADDNYNQAEPSTATQKRRPGRPRKMPLPIGEEAQRHLTITGRRSTPQSPKIAVKVDLDRVENAIRRDSRNCMIAEAIKETVPDMAHVTVDLQSIRFSDPAKNLRFVYLTPRVCQIAIIDFDRGLKPEAFSFVLRKPYQITRPARTAGKPGRTPMQRAAAARNQYEIRKRITATEDAPFKPPIDYAQKVVQAMGDPDAELGPIVALDSPNASNGSVPIFVGGTAPRYPGNGNIQRMRVFGLKALTR